MPDLAPAHRLAGFLPVIALCLPGAAYADDLEEMVVLGSRIPADPQSGLEIIDRETLESFGAASLTQVLSQTGSIHVSNNAGRGSLNSLYLRGADPNFTQIQINGIPVNDPMNSRGGAYDLGALSAQAIERIEILPTSASALYGSQALAGVINITTREAVGGGEISASLDSRSGYGITFLAGGARASVLGFVEAPGARVGGSDYRAGGIAARTSLDVSDQGNLAASLRLQNSEASAFPDDSGGDLYAVSRELENRKPKERAFDFNYTHGLANSSRLRLQGSYFEHDETIFTPAVMPGPRDPAGLPAITSDNEYRRSKLKLHYLWPADGKHRFVAGIEWYDETGSSVGMLDFSVFQLPSSFDLDRQTTSAFGEWQWVPSSNFRAAIGGLFDNTDSGDRFSPRIHFERSFSDSPHILHATWGKGYKLPSFYALGQPLIGNPDLNDETSDSLEVGYRYATPRSEAAVVLFRNEFHDLIDFEPGPPPQLVNRDRVSTRGGEARLNLMLQDDISLKTYYSFVDADVETEDVRLRHRPRSRAGLGIVWQARSGLTAGLNSRFVGKQFDSSIATGDVELSSYIVTDASLQWNPGDRLRATVAVENLFGENYEDSIGNPVKGTTVMLQVNFRMSSND